MLYTCALLFAFEPDIGYFSLTSPLPSIANAILLLSILWGASALIFIPRDKLSVSLPEFSTAAVFVSALCGFLFILFALLAFYAALRGNVFFPGETYFRDLFIHYAISTSAFLSGLYFVTACKSTLIHAPWRTCLSFFPTIWALLTLAQCYFDLTHAMNNPIKIMLHLALMGIMLFFLQESRFLLGRAQPRLSLFCTYAALLLCGSGGLSSIFAFAKSSATLEDYFFPMLALSVIWFYMLIRLINTLSENLRSDKKSISDQSAQSIHDEGESAV